MPPRAAECRRRACCRRGAAGPADTQRARGPQVELLFATVTLKYGDK